MEKAALKTITVIVFFSLGFAYAQNCSEILAPSRAIDWSKAGVEGGIPTRTTVYQTFNPGATADQINAAITACPSDQVVYLNEGTYRVS